MGCIPSICPNADCSKDSTAIKPRYKQEKKNRKQVKVLQNDHCQICLCIWCKSICTIICGCRTNQYVSLDACYMYVVNRRKIRYEDLMLVNTAHPIIPARSVEGMYFHSSPYQPISLSDLELRGS